MFLSTSRSQLLGVQKKSCMLPENECAESSDGGGGVSIIGGLSAEIKR